MLGAGAAPWLRVNGMRGEQAEPALRAMIDRLYEDATSFGFPEERFERLYEEVESTLFRDAVSARVVAPLAGVRIESDRVDLGRGLSLVWAIAWTRPRRLSGRRVPRVTSRRFSALSSATCRRTTTSRRPRRRSGSGVS